MVTKKLIVANGRGNHKGFDGYLYICAYSKADAVRLLKEAGYATMTIGEFNAYWSKGCWGNSMCGISQERGVWFQREDSGGHAEGKPERVL
jgi:hypothetical protein